MDYGLSVVPKHDGLPESPLRAGEQVPFIMLSQARSAAQGRSPPASQGAGDQALRAALRRPPHNRIWGPRILGRERFSQRLRKGRRSEAGRGLLVSSRWSRHLQDRVHQGELKFQRAN